MLAVPDEYGRGQHRHEQAAAEREPNREARAGIGIIASPQLLANSPHPGMKVWAVRYALERSSIINATVAIRKVNIIAEGDVITSITFCGVCEQQSC